MKKWHEKIAKKTKIVELFKTRKKTVKNPINMVKIYKINVKNNNYYYILL